MNRRSEALAQLLETALSERLATPVVELLGAIPTPLAIVHATDLRLVAANAAMHDLLGRGGSEAVGLRMQELVDPAHPLSDPRPYREVAGQNQPMDRAVVIDGLSWRWFIRPLTGREPRVEYLLTGLYGALDASDDPAIARLREANAAKTDFLNMAAHELRTPLGVIHGYGSLLAQGGLSAEHQQLAGLRVYEKAKQLSRLITDMMLVARFDELGPDLPRARLDLVSLVDKLVEDLRHRSPDLAIELTLDVPAAPVMGNPDWLRLAVSELLDNAGRFRPRATGRIDVGLADREGAYLLTIVDDGFGIDPLEHGRLFRRFSRIETDENRHLVGLGIGLHLVMEVARAHGGRVDMVSRLGLGSEFRLVLPRG